MIIITCYRHPILPGGQQHNMHIHRPSCRHHIPSSQHHKHTNKHCDDVLRISMTFDPFNSQQNIHSHFPSNIHSNFHFSTTCPSTEFPYNFSCVHRNMAIMRLKIIRVISAFTISPSFPPMSSLIQSLLFPFHTAYDYHPHVTAASNELTLSEVAAVGLGEIGSS